MNYYDAITHLYNRPQRKPLTSRRGVGGGRRRPAAEALPLGAPHTADASSTRGIEHLLQHLQHLQEHLQGDLQGHLQDYEHLQGALGNSQCPSDLLRPAVTSPGAPTRLWGGGWWVDMENFWEFIVLLWHFILTTFIVNFIYRLKSFI